MEFTAKVNALFRRLSSDNFSNSLVFEDGVLSIDYDKRVVKVRGEEVAFTPNKFDILYVLALNKVQVLFREQRIDKIFETDFEGYDRTIDVHIKNIQKKICHLYLKDFTEDIRVGIE